MRKSILLVTVDCLRADHVGFMGYPRATTPFLDSLAAEAFVVPAAIVAGAPTYYSLPAILASRYPLALGRDVLGIAPGEATLASTLKQAGYATAAFGAANPYISSRFGYKEGFEEFCDFLQAEHAPSWEETMDTGTRGWARRLNQSMQETLPSLGPLGVIYEELYFQYCQRVTPLPDSLDTLRRFPAADVIVDRACSWLASIGDAPFFLWLHLMDPHSPYYPNAESLSLLEHDPITPFRARYLNSYWNRSDLGTGRLSRRRDDVLALYDAGIRWVDMQLERLIDSLRNSNRWSQCILAVTADHGEEFLEHGGRYHPPSRLMEELIHVPLMLRVPGNSKKQLTGAPFSLLDLAPTLLDAAGALVPSGFRGESRWPQIREGLDYDATAVTECVSGCTNPFRREDRLGPRVLSVRGRRFKLVLHFERPSECLYDLEADPGEQAPLAPTAQKPARRYLLERAREHLRGSTREHLRGSIGEEEDVRHRVRARMRDLRLELERSYPQRAAM